MRTVALGRKQTLVQVRHRPKAHIQLAYTQSAQSLHLDAMLSFQGRMLKRAAEVCGGYMALRVRLGTVNALRVTTWLEGRSPLPDQVFLKAADIVLEDDIARAAQDRRTNPRR